MIRSGLAVLALLATTAASPSRSLPIPPIPPAYPPADQSAPMPDRDLLAPVLPSLLSQRVTVHDFRARRFQQGLGYAPGSQFESDGDKRPIQTPGLTVRLPLQ